MLCMLFCMVLHSKSQFPENAGKRQKSAFSEKQGEFVWCFSLKIASIDSLPTACLPDSGTVSLICLNQSDRVFLLVGRFVPISPT